MSVAELATGNSLKPLCGPGNASAKGGESLICLVSLSNKRAQLGRVGGSRSGLGSSNKIPKLYEMNMWFVDVFGTS